MDTKPANVIPFKRPTWDAARFWASIKASANRPRPVRQHRPDYQQRCLSPGGKSVACSEAALFIINVCIDAANSCDNPWWFFDEFYDVAKAQLAERFPSLTPPQLRRKALRAWDIMPSLNVSERRWVKPVWTRCVLKDIELTEAEIEEARAEMDEFRNALAPKA